MPSDPSALRTELLNEVVSGASPRIEEAPSARAREGVGAPYVGDSVTVFSACLIAVSEGFAIVLAPFVTPGAAGPCPVGTASTYASTAEAPGPGVLCARAGAATAVNAAAATIKGIPNLSLVSNIGLGLLNGE